MDGCAFGNSFVLDYRLRLIHIEIRSDGGDEKNDHVVKQYKKSPKVKWPKRNIETNGNVHGAHVHTWGQRERRSGRTYRKREKK